MKKFISFLLVIVLAFSCISVFSYAEDTTVLYKDGDFEFYIKDSLAYITKVYLSESNNANIPARVCCDDDKKIGTIVIDSFVDDDNVTPDYFGKDYVFVGGLIDGAFDEISEQVESISIPRYLTEFDIGVFYGLSSLKTISVNENNPDFSSSNGTLYDASKTKLLFHPQASADNSILSTVNSIEAKAFYYSVNLTSITIPSGVSSIPERCFESCTSLKSISLPETVTQIDRFAFTDSGLTSLNLPAGVKDIKAFAFNNCSSLATLNISDSVSELKINSCAFFGCPIMNVIIPRGVSQISDKAFGYYYDDDYNLNKYEDLVITSYKYNEDKSDVTAAYTYAKASANSFEFIPLDDIFSVKYSFNFLKGYQSTMYLYNKKELAYSVSSNNGVFEINDIAAGKYNIYITPDIGTRISAGSVSIAASADKELYEFSSKSKCPIGDVKKDGVINIDDLSLLLKAENYGSNKSEFDVDLDGSVGMSDISVILSSYNFGRTDAEISSVIVTPIIPINS